MTPRARAGAGHRLPRVNLGTAALEHPEWTARAIAEHGDRVASASTCAARRWPPAGLDPRGRRPLGDPGPPRCRGCARYVVTDVAKDGMLQGPNLALLRDVCARTDRPSSRRAGCRRSTTSSPSAAWCPRGSRARSSARRSTGARSRCPRRSTRRAAREPRPRPRPRSGGLGAGAVGRPRPLAERVRDRHRCGRPRPAGRARRTRRRPRPDAGGRGEPVRRADRRRPTEADTTGELAVETQVDMAAVTLVAPDGQRALPVFSGTDALTAWDPTARPVPVTPGPRRPGRGRRGLRRHRRRRRRAGTRVLRPSMVWALAQQRPWAAGPHRPVRRPQRRGRRARRGRRHGPRARGGQPARRGRARCRARPAPRASTPSRCGPSRPGWGSGSPPTASCAPGSTVSPSGCGDDFGGCRRAGNLVR